jgi:hypothetical protein
MKKKILIHLHVREIEQRQILIAFKVLVTKLICRLEPPSNNEKKILIHLHVREIEQVLS